MATGEGVAVAEAARVMEVQVAALARVVTPHRPSAGRQLGRLLGREIGG